MQVLITGATGLIGKAITKLLHKEGHTVHYLTTSKEKITTKEDYKGFYWDPSTEEIDINCLLGTDAIINLAGATVTKRWTTTYKKEILNSRIQSIRTLKKAIEKAENLNINSFVSASAVGIYPSSQDSLYSEDEKTIDDSFLGSVVKAWENEADSLRELNIPLTKIRIGLVLAKEGGALPKMTKPIRNYIGAAFGDGEQWQSWIHIEDLARIFLYVIENKCEGVFNGVAPNPVTNTKLTKEIAITLNKPLILPNIPRFVMNLILGEMSYVLFSSQRVSSSKIQSNGFEFYHSNVKGALENLLSSDKRDNSETNNSFLEEYVS